jgi:glycosyltransferase involved in cell wall biosynthesis
MDVSVIVCTHNRAAMLRDVLAGLATQRGMDTRSWEAIVVDNCSTDETADVVRGASLPVPLRYLYEAVPGKSFALNAGIAASTGRILAFTDDDVQLTPDWLAGLVEVMERFGCVGVGGPVVPVWRAEKPDWVADSGPYAMQGAIVEFRGGPEPAILEAAPLGANSAYLRSAFAEYGPFRTDMGHTGRVPMPCEDTEFARRVQRGGGELRFAPRAVVYHPVEASRLTRRYFLDWYSARGRAEMVEEPPRPGSVSYFGVPRYLFRTLGEAVARWATARDPRKRFYYKLRSHYVVGAMRQARAAHRDRAARTSPGPR